MAADLPKGVFRTPTGYRVFAWVKDPRYAKSRGISTTFPADTPLDTMLAWRAAQRVQARRRQTTADNAVPEGTGLLADFERYLQTVRALPSWTERRREMRAWAVALIAAGIDQTRTITSTIIRAVRDQWLTVGPKCVQERQANGHMAWVETPRPLAPQSVNLRLRALENFFTVMCPGQPNPVREVDEVEPPAPEPRGETFRLGLEIVAHMPDVTTPKKGELPEAGSKSRARFEVMLWTGLEASQVGRLTPEMVDWTVPAFIAPRRRKGRRGKGRQRGRPSAVAPRELLPEAVTALRHLFALHANTPFKSSSISRSVKAAIRNANVARAAQELPLIPLTLRIKDLTRHTYGTEVYRATKNLKHVQVQLGHSDQAMSQRYAMRAIEDDLRSGMKALAKRARQATQPLALVTGKRGVG